MQARLRWFGPRSFCGVIVAIAADAYTTVCARVISFVDSPIEIKLKMIMRRDWHLHIVCWLLFIL
jgi:hypothetical protein